MKKALSLVAVAAAGFLAVSGAPRSVPAAKVDETVLNAHIDARLHTLLGKVVADLVFYAIAAASYERRGPVPGAQVEPA